MWEILILSAQAWLQKASLDQRSFKLFLKDVQPQTLANLQKKEFQNFGTVKSSREGTFPNAPTDTAKIAPCLWSNANLCKYINYKNDALCNPDAELTIISPSSNFNQKRLKALVRGGRGGETRELSPLDYAAL